MSATNKATNRPANTDVTSLTPAPVEAGRSEARADFVAELRRRRSEHGLTQQAAAKGMRVQRVTLTQWESGRHLPSSEKAREVDEFFGAGGTLAALAEAARTGSPARPVRRPQTLADVFRAVGSGLLRHLIRDTAGKPLGWCHSLGRGTIATPLSTAYCIRTLLLLDDTDVDLHLLAQEVSKRQSGGGWANRAPGDPRPEVTAVVLDAISQLGAGANLDGAWRFLESSIDAGRDRPYVLCAVLETVVRHRPASPLATRLVDDLLAARMEFDRVLLWPANAGADPARVEASLAHTARAVTMLRAAQVTMNRPDVEDAIDQALQWIVARDREDDGTTEILRIERDRRALDVPINHFTSAWVLRALAGSDGVPGPRIQSALATLWGSYSPQDGLWVWLHDGQLPSWMTFDAVAALRTIAIASFPTPIASSPEDDVDPTTAAGSPLPSPSA